MPNVTVKATYVNPPKPGKRSGSIKGDNGSYYGFEPSKFQPIVGKTYDITYTVSPDGKWNNVMELREVVSLVSGGPGATASGSVSGISQSEAIFVTGVIGRAFHGTGNIPGEDQLTTMVRACVAAFRAGTAPAEADEPY